MSLFSTIAFFVSGVFPILYLAGAILFFIRFRGTPAGLIGALGFLAWFALLAVRTVLLIFGVDIQPYIHGFQLHFCSPLFSCSTALRPCRLAARRLLGQHPYRRLAVRLVPEASR